MGQKMNSQIKNLIEDVVTCLMWFTVIGGLIWYSVYLLNNRPTNKVVYIQEC